ncbi:MAG: hypothetical protein UZ21_OP11001000709 [Microgenomates bacterium OLB22]|nr:MAG: hypothetical protein UZ21_OP11001000709 [Microgenomates bacterium OLB22]
MALWVWFAFLMVLYVFPVRNWTFSDTTLQGTSVTFNASADSKVEIEGDNVYFMAGACSYYAIFDNQVVITGEPVSKPLGVEECAYFKTDERKINSGTWIVASGYPEITLTSETPLKVTVARSDGSKVSLYILLFVVIGLVFILGCIVGDSLIPSRPPLWYIRLIAAKRSTSSR